MWFMGKKQKKKNSIEKEELVFLCIFYGEVVGKSFVEDVVSRLIACDKIQEIKLFLVEEKKNTAVI